MFFEFRTLKLRDAEVKYGVVAADEHMITSLSKGTNLEKVVETSTAFFITMRKRSERGSYKFGDGWLKCLEN